MALEKQARRVPRRKVLKDGKIVSHHLHGAIDVRIRDLSDAGALIELPLATLLAQTFDLLVVSEHKVYPSIVRWRRGDRMGLEFTGAPKTASLRKW